MTTGPTPRLEIYPDRLAHNAHALAAECAASGIAMAAVTKVMLAHTGLLRALSQAPISMIADSRIDNLKRVAGARLGVPTLLLRAPTPRTAAEVVRWADYSLNSAEVTVRALSEAAKDADLVHRVIIMADLGDLREGLWPDRVVETVTAIAGLPHIEVSGLGTNLACYGGVLPTVEKMNMLVELRDACAAATGLELPILSGGNSANLPLLASGQMPAGINHLRLGEAMILGRETLHRTPWPGTRQDAVRLVGQVIEVAIKPSVPLGEHGEDAFGRIPTFVDRGMRLRAICDIGRQDADPEDLQPTDDGITVVGGSSDHLILDVTDAADTVHVGSEISFWPTYGALLRASTSAFVHKVIVPRNGATTT